MPVEQKPGRPYPLDPVGLCALCAHHRVIESTKGSHFWLCALNVQDARFPRYPRLPVLVCEGFVPSPSGDR
ncbi:MAG: hypothetical protein HZB53_14300 [Chloroflexi bacterium]|nr:hypothetical protein [Chloroflexota bacterium]